MFWIVTFRAISQRNYSNKKFLRPRLFQEDTNLPLNVANPNEVEYDQVEARKLAVRRSADKENPLELKHEFDDGSDEAFQKDFPEVTFEWVYKLKFVNLIQIFVFVLAIVGAARGYRWATQGTEKRNLGIAPTERPLLHNHRL
jgi:hypothetical protein